MKEAKLGPYIQWNNPFKKREKGDGEEEEITDDIGFMPGDSEWDSRKPYDKDIINQHILNKPRKPKKGKEYFDKNRDRVV
jgi:hypothetical protein